MLKIDIYNFSFDFEWCQYNNIHQSIFVEYEYDENDYYQLFEMVQNRNDIWLIEQLWKLIRLNKLAFVHRRVVKEDVNLHFTLSG